MLTQIEKSLHDKEEFALDGTAGLSQSFIYLMIRLQSDITNLVSDMQVGHPRKWRFATKDTILDNLAIGTLSQSSLDSNQCPEDGCTEIATNTTGKNYCKDLAKRMFPIFCVKKENLD